MLRQSFFMVALGAVALALFASPASAGGNTQVSGVGAFDADGSCTDDPASWYTMDISGDLDGCWYNHGWEVVVSTPSGSYQERGTETFVGCWKKGTPEEICGTFDTTYTFTAKFAPDGSEIRGRCQHPIVSGTGGFEGIKGRVDFKDEVANGVAYYRGHFQLR